MPINSWSGHYQSVWLERAKDRTLPDWLRLAGLAFAKHKANGHANFGLGEIGRLLADVSPSGECKPLSKSEVSNAIKLAKDKGFIDRASCARCLVVPAHAVTGGLGNWHEKCRVHDGARSLSAA